MEARSKPKVTPIGNRKRKPEPQVERRKEEPAPAPIDPKAIAKEERATLEGLTYCMALLAAVSADKSIMSLHRISTLYTGAQITGKSIEPGLIGAAYFGTLERVIIDGRIDPESAAKSNSMWLQFGRLGKKDLNEFTPPWNTISTPKSDAPKNYIPDLLIQLPGAYNLSAPFRRALVLMYGHTHQSNEHACLSIFQARNKGLRISHALSTEHFAVLQHI